VYPEDANSPKPQSPDNQHLPIGEAIGQEAFTEAEDQGENYCRHERQRIAVSNEPKILAAKAEYAHLEEIARDLKERISKAPLPADVKTRRRKMWCYRLLVALLSLSAFVFLLVAFEPFRLGWKAWLYGVGIALVTPVLVDLATEKLEPRMPWISKVIVTVACIAALSAQMFIAVVRGNVMREQMTATKAVIVVEGEDSEPAPAGEAFYNQNAGTLQLAMLLFALSLELGAGIAWHQARRWGVLEGEDRDQLQAQFNEVRGRQIGRGYEVARLQAEPDAFEEQFWRDFRRAITKRLRNGGQRVLPLLLFAVALAFVGPAEAQSKDRLNLIVAIDLSRSVTDAKGLDGKTEFDRNVVAASHLLATVPAGARVTILGITDRSFREPYILLAAEVDGDEGYFKERLTAARQRLVRTWQDRRAGAIVRFERTDILGTLFIVAQLLRSDPGWRNVLILLSDMQQDTPELNLATRVRLERAMEAVVQQGSMVRLSGVDVHVLGVGGKNPRRWQALRGFWVGYFAKAGANLRTYSMMREVPKL